MHMIRITYIRPFGYRETAGVTMSSCDVYPEIADEIIARMDIRDIVDVTEIPWCGWRNPWRDSGDRGAARADHMRHCDVCAD